MSRTSNASVVDAYHGDPTLHVLAAASVDRPALRAKLASADFTGADALPLSAFAWPEKRRFPIHSEADTLASIVYRSKVASDIAVPAHVDAALERAVRAWAIDAEVMRPSGATKSAMGPVVGPEYAVPSQNRLPLGSAQQVKVAEEVLLRDGLTALPYAELTAGAKKIASAAESYGLFPSAQLRRLAGVGACHLPTLQGHLAGRAAFAKTASAVAAYDQLSHAIDRYVVAGTKIAYDIPALEKIANALHALDVEHDVESQYGPRVLDPMSVVFNTTYDTKLAAADLETITLGGQAVPLAALYKMAAEDWRDLGLDDFAELGASRDGRNLAAQLRVLPRGIQAQVASAALAL